MEIKQVSGYVRMTRRRVMGGVAFLEGRLNGRFVQLLCERKILANFTDASKAPLGAIMKVKGHEGKSRNGTDVIIVEALDIVAHPARPYPAPENTSAEADRLSLLLVDDLTFNRFQVQSEVTKRIRSAFHHEGYREYPTGTLQPVFEGGTAQPFLTRCAADGMDYALALTSEIKLKQLLAAGEARVFEIFQSFRNEGINASHSPEFTLLEAYEAGGGLDSMMVMLEMILRTAAGTAADVALDPERWDGLVRPFDRIDYALACQELLGFPAEEATLDNLIRLFPESFHMGMATFTWTFKLINRFIAPKLTHPTYITYLPSGLSPLVKAQDDDIRYAERASLLINGVDVADVYVDETDMARVEAALLEQSKLTGREPNRRFLELLAYGMPPSAGVGMGLNRLFMALDKKAPRIQDTILFPFYRT
jgi:lysyl-tRNA synthetase class 2